MQVLFFLKLVAIFAPTGYPLIIPIIKAKAPSPRILKSGFIYLFKIFPSCVIILVCIKSSVATKKGKIEGITEFAHRAKPDFTAGKLLFENNNKLKVELIYYILPLIYNDTIKSKLVKSNAKSTFNTFLNSEVKMELIVIETLLTNYKKKTKEALITLSNIYNISLNYIYNGKN